MKIIIYKNPIGKPRMSQRDKWYKRPQTEKYWLFKQSVKLYTKNIDLSKINIVSWKAFFEMPKSWSTKKRFDMLGKPHLVKPDRDNIDKGVLDALFDNDARIYGCRYMWKFWNDGNGSRIELELE